MKPSTTRTRTSSGSSSSTEHVSSSITNNENPSAYHYQQQQQQGGETKSRSRGSSLSQHPYSPRDAQLYQSTSSQSQPSSSSSTTHSQHQHQHYQQPSPHQHQHQHQQPSAAYAQQSRHQPSPVISSPILQSIQPAPMREFLVHVEMWCPYGLGGSGSGNSTLSKKSGKKSVQTIAPGSSTRSRPSSTLLSSTAAAAAKNLNATTTSTMSMHTSAHTSAHASSSDELALAQSMSAGTGENLTLVNSIASSAAALSFAAAAAVAAAATNSGIGGGGLGISGGGSGKKGLSGLFGGSGGVSGGGTGGAGGGAGMGAGGRGAKGYWKRAVCKLSGEGGTWGPHSATSANPTGSALLTIYSAEDNTLQHVINVHKLTSTDVRPAEKSLFRRTDVLAIWGHPAAMSLSTNPTLSPIHLAFSSPDAHNTWLVLLRSYTTPEIYGRMLSLSLPAEHPSNSPAANGGGYSPPQPPQGGLYRMWRQVEMNVVSARNLSLNSHYPAATYASSASAISAGQNTTGGGGGASGTTTRVKQRPSSSSGALASASTTSPVGGGGGGTSPGIKEKKSAGFTSVKTGVTAVTTTAATIGTTAPPATSTTGTTTTASLKSYSTTSLPISVESSEYTASHHSSSSHHHQQQPSHQRASSRPSKEQEKALKEMAKEREREGKAMEKERKEREKKERKERERLGGLPGLFCEVVLDGEVCGRSTIKKAVPSATSSTGGGAGGGPAANSMVTLVGSARPGSAGATSASAGAHGHGHGHAGPGGGGGGGINGSIIPGPRGEGVTAEWFESFLFGDLPSFGNMQIMLWKATPEATKEKEKEKEKEKKEERPRSSKGTATTLSSNDNGTTSGTTSGGVTTVVGSTTSVGDSTSAAAAAAAATGGGVAGAGPSSSAGGAKGTVFVGCVEVSLPNFRRGEWVEGWWPVYAHANAMGGNSLSTLSSLGLGMGTMGMGMGGMSGVGGVTGALVQIGEIKLKIKVDEEIILPSRAYKNVLDALEKRNYLDVLSDLESKLKIDHSLLSNHIVSLAVARNRLLKDIVQLAEREVANLSGSTNTLFRGNTVLTKTMETAMGWYGKSFLDISVGPIIRRMISENVEIEVDPSRLSASAFGASSKRPGTKDSYRPSTRDSYRPGTKESMMSIVIGGKSEHDTAQEQGIRLLEYWCNELWNHIYVVRTECPVELRRLFGHIRMMVERRFETEPSYDASSSDPSANAAQYRAAGAPPVHSAEMLPWQAISSFVFLRFLVPAILNPHLFGLCPGMPPKGVVRSLTLLAKCTQSLANLNPGTSQKEEYMRGIKGLLERSTVTMIDYLAYVSSVPDPFSPSANASSFLSGPDKHDRLHVINSLRERLTGTGNMIPTLYKDAIPLLPYALDVPKHLAILSSAVVRNARSGNAAAYLNAQSIQAAGNEDTEEWSLARFSALCFDVEAQALKSVATLAQGAASAGAFGGTRTKRSTSVSSAWGNAQQQQNGIHASHSNGQLRPSQQQQQLQPQQQQASLASPVSGSSTSRGATPTGHVTSTTTNATTTPTQMSPSPWNTATSARRPTSSRSTTMPVAPVGSSPLTASSQRSQQQEDVREAPRLVTTSNNGNGKKKKSARPSTAPSAISSGGSRPDEDEPFVHPDLSRRNKMMEPDASPSASFRYLPPDPSRPHDDNPVPETPVSSHGSSYGSRNTHGQGFPTLHRTESETFVPFHYPTSASSRYATVGPAASASIKSSSGPFVGLEKMEKRERRSSFSRLKDMMKRPSTSSGPLSAGAAPSYAGGHPWAEQEHSPHSSSGEEMSATRSRAAAYPNRRVDSIGTSSGEGQGSSGKKGEHSGGEPKKKRGIFGWLKK